MVNEKIGRQKNVREAEVAATGQETCLTTWTDEHQSDVVTGTDRLITKPSTRNVFHSHLL